jgi:hypothetical protein
MVQSSDAAEEFLRQFKKIIFDTLVREIPDEALQSGHEAELGRCVERIVDARLIADKIPIGRQLRKKLIESILADIQRGGRELFSGG